VGVRRATAALRDGAPAMEEDEEEAEEEEEEVEGEAFALLLESLWCRLIAHLLGPVMSVSLDKSQLCLVDS